MKKLYIFIAMISLMGNQSFAEPIDADSILEIDNGSTLVLTSEINIPAYENAWFDESGKRLPPDHSDFFDEGKAECHTATGYPQDVRLKGTLTLTASIKYIYGEVGLKFKTASGNLMEIDCAVGGNPTHMLTIGEFKSIFAKYGTLVLAAPREI